MTKQNATTMLNSPHKKQRSSNNGVDHSYYLEHCDDNMQYSYFHSRIKDKLVGIKILKNYYHPQFLDSLFMDY